MAKGYIGESRSARAHDRMDRYVSRSTESHRPALTLLSQLKAAYGNSWQDALDEMRREIDPAYRAGKTAAAAAAAHAWQTTAARHSGISLESAVETAVSAWKSSFKLSSSRA